MVEELRHQSIYDLGIHFYQIYYRDEQKNEMYPFAIPFLNNGLTLFFENSPIASLVPTLKCNKVSITSWKLRQKFKYSFFKHQNFTADHLKGEYDVLSLTKNTREHRMLQAADKWHPGFMNIMTLLWSKLGLKMPTEVKNPINHNFFSTKTEIYQDYVENLLKPAMNLMENDPELIPLCMADSKYTSLERGANTENLKKYLGLDYYPMHPFICERLFPMWCEMKKIKVNYLV